MPLARFNGQLLRVDGLLSTDCCCDDGPRCVTICCSLDSGFIGNCQQPGIFEHTIQLAGCYTLPVPINIRGFVNDDLLLDGQSITTDLMLDPGPYPDTVGFGCVGAHTIGEKPGPFADAVNGGITFPISARTFTLSLRDTIGFGASIDITVCVDPSDTQRCSGGLLLTGTCDPGTNCNPLP